MCEDPTVDFILDVWFEQWVEDRMSSVARVKSIIKNLKSYFAGMPLSTVERKHSREYAEGRLNGSLGKGVAVNGTIRLELIKLRAAFNFMVSKVEPRERRIDSKMLPYVELPPDSEARDIVISRENIKRIYDFCMVDGPRAGSKYSGPNGWITREARFCIIAMETAARKTAICELTWDQVKWEKGVIQLNPDGRKQTSKKRPTIPMSNKLLAMLEKVYPLRKNELVLDSKTKISDGVHRIMRELGIEGVTPHTFRHTWATHKIEDGKPIKKVADFLGDTEETVRKSYEHLSPDYLRDVIN